MSISDFYRVLPYAISLGALLVSVAGYRLNLKLFNQNKVFEEKIKSYTEITRMLDSLISTLIGNLHEGQEILKNRHGNWEDDLDQLADEIDEAIERFNSSVTVNSLLIPSSVIDYFDNFADFLDDDTNDKILEQQHEFDNFIDALYSKSEGLIIQMREDLNADKLNNGLQKRIRGNWGHKMLVSPPNNP